MAGDWIKMRVCLWTHPKVVTLASRLSVTRCHAVGALHCVWGIADQHADENGHIQMTADALDSLCETKGMTAAMIAVGWAQQENESLQFINYQEHNGSTAKLRANASSRQKLSRSRHARVTKKRDKTVTREEKRREEKNTPFPPVLDTPEFAAAWADWLSHRQEIRKPLKATAIKNQLAKLAAWGLSRAVSAIRHSLANGWSGIFEPDDNKAPTANGRADTSEVKARFAQAELNKKEAADRAALLAKERAEDQDPSEDDPFAR